MGSPNAIWSVTIQPSVRNSESSSGCRLRLSRNISRMSCWLPDHLTYIGIMTHEVCKQTASSSYKIQYQKRLRACSCKQCKPLCKAGCQISISLMWAKGRQLHDFKKQSRNTVTMWSAGTLTESCPVKGKRAYCLVSTTGSQAIT